MGSFGILQAMGNLHSAIVISIMGLMSVWLVTEVFLRLNFFRKINVDSQELMKETHRALSSKDTKAIATLKGQRASDAPVRILISTGLCNRDLTPAELSEVFAVARIRQTERVTKRLAIFGTMATIAPFIGLLGTVIGIVQSFNSLAQTGAAGPNVVAGGVATALWATAAGLVVAIPAVVAHNFFRNKAKTIITDMEVVSREMISLFKMEDIGRLKAV